jgi:hypothetical protein
VPVRPSQEPWPYGIVAGPDGAMWFTNLYSNKIGRIDMGGSITIHPVGAENPGGNGEIVAGPDGAFWFTDIYGTLGRITVSGSSTLYPAASTSPLPRALTVGPDDNLWVPTDANTITQAVLSPTSCTVVPTYSNGTLTVNYYLRTPAPLQWTGVVKSSGGVVTHWSTPIAATAAYRTGALQFPGIAPTGLLSVVSSLRTETGAACEDKEGVWDVSSGGATALAFRSLPWVSGGCLESGHGLSPEPFGETPQPIGSLRNGPNRELTRCCARSADQAKVDRRLPILRCWENRYRGYLWNVAKQVSNPINNRLSASLGLGKAKSESGKSAVSTCQKRR